MSGKPGWKQEAPEVASADGRVKPLSRLLRLRFGPAGDSDRPLRISWRQLYRQFGADPAKAGDTRTVDNHRTDKGTLVVLPSSPRRAPGVLDELKERTPKLPSGSRRNKYFQWFTPEFGHPKLLQHLAAVTALMRAAPNWDAFKRSLGRAFPDKNKTIPLPLDYGDE